MIKYYNWEQAFEQRVQQMRNSQMDFTLKVYTKVFGINF